MFNFLRDRIKRGIFNREFYTYLPAVTITNSSRSTNVSATEVITLAITMSRAASADVVVHLTIGGTAALYDTPLTNGKAAAGGAVSRPNFTR